MHRLSSSQPDSRCQGNTPHSPCHLLLPKSCGMPAAAGCANRYGAQTTGSRHAAWQRYPSWPTYFTCQPCPDGLVPLSPQSNLQPSYDSKTASWSLKIASKAAAVKAKARSIQARAANAGGVSVASAATAPEPVLTARQQAVVVTNTQRAVQAASDPATGCGADCEQPWGPYECVPCPEGTSVDFYGVTCGEYVPPLRDGAGRARKGVVLGRGGV